MTIEITTRDGNQGYVQVRSHDTIGPRTWWISAIQERRVLRELGAPIGDGLLSGRYVAMHMDGGEQIPVQMEARREGGVTLRARTAASMAGSALGSIRTAKKALSSAENGKLGGRPKKK